MTDSFVYTLAADVLRDGEIESEDGRRLAALPDHELPDLLLCANRIRERFRGQSIELCGIISAKSGDCAENCRFCSQSVHHRTEVKCHPVTDEASILAAARASAGVGATRFGIVTSGGCLTEPELATACRAIRSLAEDGIEPCASLGRLTDESAARLREAGLRRYNHNVETAASHFPNVCTTHKYEDRVETVKVARAAGLEVCCGGIFGLGESWEQRIELAFALKALDVDVVPINFLNPVKGTPLEEEPLLAPREALKIIAIFRFILPTKHIKICGGREVVLRDLQSWMFYAGASGTLIGNYLTTLGRQPEEDLQMLADLGLTPAPRPAVV